MNFLKDIQIYNSNVCLIDKNNKKFTYKEIIEKSYIISKKLNSRDFVIVLAENNIEFITSYISFFRKGIIQMLLDSKIPSSSLKEILEKYKPNYILLPKNRYREFNYETVSEFENYKLLKINKNKYHETNKDLSLLLTTSGSTGSKKFVRISYENIHENTKSIIKFLKIKKNHTTITTMPPFYTYGLSILNTHLYKGASIVVTNSSIIEKPFWKLMTEENVNSFGAVPYHYEVLKKIKFDKIKLPSLRYFTQAGGAMSKELTRYLIDFSKKNKKKFIIMYGQTEATARMTYLKYEMVNKKIGSIGTPIPGGKIILKNNKNKRDDEGEIIYKGKNVSMGYAEELKDLNKGDLNHGTLSTGDLAKKDKDGYLYIIGRKSRDIKLFGHRVNLDELEKVLYKKGYNCICHGLNNKVTIFFKNKSYDKKILDLLNKETKINKICFKLKFITKFPLNVSGKINYKKLEKIL